MRTTRKFLAAAILISGLFAAACSNDLFGLFASTDLDKRLEEKTALKFVTSAEDSSWVTGTFSPYSGAKPGEGLSLGSSFSFIVVSDTHIEDGDAHGLENLGSKITSDPAIKFVVITGDITQNGKREDVQRFVDIAKSLPVPCYPVIGNHDIFFGNWPIWKELIGASSYRIDHGSDVRLFILDTANAYFGASQLDWLERELAINPTVHTFVFTHANVFVRSPIDIEQLTDVRERARFLKILKGRSDAVFMGHVHQRIIDDAGGVKYITLEDFVGHGTYCRVTVNSGGMSYEFHKL
ncbi:MAG: metallophosphoesterase [Treponema sp.]|jgi:predicted phosphodiesterase|nr:metallophosphoesterase [Treponema sp.]